MNEMNEMTHDNLGGESVVHSVQLNPAILNNVRQRVYDSIELVLIDSLYTFYSKMFLKATDDASGHEELNPLNVFIDRLDLISLWGEDIVSSTTDALQDHAEKKFKFFKLKKFLKKILSTQLCQAAALENRACSSKIQLNDVHIQEFLYNLLKLSAPHVSNAPQLFTPRRGQEYVKREESLDMFLCRSIKRALSQFVELFLWRISEGEIDSPFVAIPKAAVDGPQSESIAFKELGDEDQAAGARVTEPDTNEFGMPASETPEPDDGLGAEDEHLRENDDENMLENDDENRPWKLDEGSRGRYNDDDELEDDERRNPRKLSFNEDVELKDDGFQREKPQSILKRRDPPRIYKTQHDPDA